MNHPSDEHVGDEEEGDLKRIYFNMLLALLPSLPPSSPPSAHQSVDLPVDEERSSH